MVRIRAEKDIQGFVQRYTHPVLGILWTTYIRVDDSVYCLSVISIKANSELMFEFYNDHLCVSNYVTHFKEDNFIERM